ncbi:c-type cytochrome [Pseudoxanthobacter sp. M-2]|uniref:c-type cytochrome n=1 Tax=Pseudoxanthobacter sp. M-2 TaxID=3078754 RepID=UPI0038FD3F0D
MSPTNRTRATRMPDRAGALPTLLSACAALGLAAFGLAAPAHAGDAAAGLAKSAICASCHGPLGLSPVPTYPNLAGQNRLYLEYALRLYRSGERRGDQAGMMYTVAQALSDTDIADLAAYYADLPRPD